MNGSPHRQISWRQWAKHTLQRLLPARYFLTRGSRRTPSVFLTFDDGPHPIGTPKILDALSAAGIHATFFVIGKNVAAHPDIVRRTIAEGHAIGHHSFSHSPPEKTSASQLMREIRQTDQLLIEITGRRSKLFRPPWGRLSAMKLFRLIASGYCTVLWNKDPRDGEMESAARLRDWFDRNPIMAGDIVLLHDDNAATPEVIADVIRDPRSRGIGFRRMDVPPMTDPEFEPQRRRDAGKNQEKSQP